MQKRTRTALSQYENQNDDFLKALLSIAPSVMRDQATLEPVQPPYPTERDMKIMLQNTDPAYLEDAKKNSWDMVYQRGEDYDASRRNDARLAALAQDYTYGGDPNDPYGRRWFRDNIGRSESAMDMLNNARFQNRR